MQSGYYNAVGGMVTQFNKLDVLSNNLANLNTAGFKQDKNIIGHFQRLYQEQRDILDLKNNTVAGSKFFNRAMNKVPQVSEIYTDYKMGAFKQTSSNLDMALNDKEKFFVIKVGDKIQLTKNGSFSINEKSQLVNKDGYDVLDKNKKPITIPLGEDISVSQEGVFYVDKQYVGDLFIGYVDNMKILTKAGNGNFNIGKQELHHQENTRAVSQGFLEQSNVNPIMAMSEMIATNRLLEMSQKAASAQMDDMNNEAINKIAVNK